MDRPRARRRLECLAPLARLRARARRPRAPPPRAGRTRAVALARIQLVRALEHLGDGFSPVRRLGAWIPAGGYAAAILLQDGALVLLPAAILGAIRTPSLRASALFIVVLVIYVVSIGGDVFPKGRFLLPTLAPMAALALHACQSPTSQRLRALVAVTIPVGVLWSALWDTQAFDIAQRRENWRRFNLQPESFVRRQVERLLAASPPPKLVAHGAIGRFGYYANAIAILDIFGLVDRVVATTPRTSRRHGENEIRAPGHYRSNPEYVFGRRPDFIFIPPSDPTDRLGVPAILDLWADPRLERDYVSDEKLRAHERRDRLRSRR